MGVCIIRTNELCTNCLYLPAEDVPGYERLCAMEMNDVCSDCVRNGKKIYVRSVCYVAESDLYSRVQDNSPTLKRWKAEGK